MFSGPKQGLIPFESVYFWGLQHPAEQQEGHGLSLRTKSPEKCAVITEKSI